MSTDGQSNNILLSRLLHLSRIVVFSALPVIEHLEHMEYMRNFFRYPPGPGDPLPTPLGYPIYLIIPMIAVIVLDLIVLWKVSNRGGDYNSLSTCMFLVELFLLVLTRGGYTLPFTPVMGKVVMFFVVLLLGLLQLLVLAKIRFMTKYTTPAK